MPQIALNMYQTAAIAMMLFCPGTIPDQPR